MHCLHHQVCAESMCIKGVHHAQGLEFVHKFYMMSSVFLSNAPHDAHIVFCSG